jgi:hypothetical protein
MTSRRTWAGLGLAVAVGSLVACERDRGEGPLHAQLAVRRREAEGLRASLAKLERGEAILPEDAVVVAVSESVVTDLLNVQLPFEADAGSFRVKLAHGEAVFKGSPVVRLTGTIAPAGHPDLAGEVAVLGAFEGITIEPASGTLRATIAIDHVDLVKVAGIEKFIGGASLNELGQLVRHQIAGHFPAVQIPVKIEQSIDLESVTDGPVRIEGARMPLEVEVVEVFAASGSLWVAVRLVPGEFVRTAAAAIEPAGGSRPK